MNHSQALLWGGFSRLSRDVNAAGHTLDQKRALSTVLWRRLGAFEVVMLTALTP